MKLLIETERLQIIPFSESYLTLKYIGWLNDPEVVRYSEQRHVIHTLETCRQYLASFAGTSNYFWAITEKNQDTGHIGNINAYLDTNNSLADVGIIIGEKKVWGTGYGSEAWIAVCSFLFEIKQIRKVTAGTTAANKAMVNLMKTSGMVNDGKRLKHYLEDGNEVDIIHMAFFSDYWQNSKNIRELKRMYRIRFIEY